MLHSTALSRRDGIHVAALVLLSAALWIPRLSGPPDLRYDAGVYYILGTSIARGEGYRLLSEPGEIEAVQYPPLLPLLAAAPQWLSGSSDPAVAGVWLRGCFALFFVGYVVAAYLLARRFLAPGLALLTALVPLLHLQTSWLSDLLFAEIPFGLASLLFLLVVGRSDGRGPREALAGLLGGAAFLLRTAGLALLGAWVLESLLRRRYRLAALRFALAIIPILGWQAYIAHVHATSYPDTAYSYQRAAYQFYNVSYLENVSLVDPFVPERGKLSPMLFVERVAGNLAVIPSSVGEAISSRAQWSVWQLERLEREGFPLAPPTWTVQVCLSLLGLIALGGSVLLATRGEWLVPLYVLASIGLISLTPWPGQFERYLAPVTPLLSLSLFVALLWAWGRTAALGSTRLGHLARALVIGVPVGVFTLECLPLYKIYTGMREETTYVDERGHEHSYRLFFYSEAWRAHDVALDWLRRHARNDEIVATSTPHRAYLRSGLRAVMPPFQPDVARAQELVDAVPVHYLVIDDMNFVDISRRYGAPMVEAHPDRWELVYAAPDNASRIYRRSDPDARSTGSMRLP